MLHTQAVATDPIEAKPTHAWINGHVVRAGCVALAVAAALVGALVGLAVLWDASGTDQSVGLLTRDLPAIAGVHPLTGAMSQLGAVLWAASAAVCGLAALQRYNAGGNRRALRFFVFSGLLSIALLIDDMFMVHDYLARYYLGLQDPMILGALALAVLVYLVSYRRLILASRSLPVLLFVCVMFSVMLIVDFFQNDFVTHGYSTNLRYLLEDGTKFLGICGWLVWLTWHCVELGEK
jgi:hypothetical protein